MGQKVNPISLRLETTNRSFDSCYYNHTHSTQLFVENLKLQLYFNNLLKQTGFSQGRVLISTFFRGCESNLFYFNPLYSRENKGKRFLIKSSRSISSGKEKDISSTKHSSLFFKVNPFQRVLSQGRNSFPFSPHLISKKVVSNPFLNSPYFCFPSDKSSFLGKEKSVDREERKNGKERETLSKTTERLKTTSLKENEKENLQSDISKQLSLLVCLYQLVENKKFVVFSRKGQKKGFESFFREKKTEIHREKEIDLDGNKGKKMLLLKKEKERCEKIKEYPFSFPSVPTLLALFFGEGMLCFQRKEGEKNKEKKKKEVGNLDMLPFPLGSDKKSALLNEKLSLPFPGFLTRKTEKEVNRHYLEQRLFKETGSVFYLSFLRALNSTQSALFLCQEIVYYLEKRVSFQRIKTVLLEEVSREARIKGIRVTCSGRGGGKSKRAQRSKMETFKDGQTSLGVFSSKIDFHCESGLTGFGLVGVKVWICYP